MIRSGERKTRVEGRKEMFYLMTHSTHYIYGYLASRPMVKDHSDSMRGNTLLPYGLLFPISSKGKTRVEARVKTGGHSGGMEATEETSRLG